MCTKFQVDWTSTSSKTTLTKNFDLNRDRRTDKRMQGRTDERTHRPENIMPPYYPRWGIKMHSCVMICEICAENIGIYGV